jgi:hypothetical protein
LAIPPLNIIYRTDLSFITLKHLSAQASTGRKNFV